MSDAPERVWADNAALIARLNKMAKWLSLSGPHGMTADALQAAEKMTTADAESARLRARVEVLTKALERSDEGLNYLHLYDAETIAALNEKPRRD